VNVLNLKMVSNKLVTFYINIYSYILTNLLYFFFNSLIFCSKNVYLNIVESNIYLYNNKIYNITNDGEDKLTIKNVEIENNFVFQYKKDLDLDVLIADYDFDEGLTCGLTDIKFVHCKNTECERSIGYVKYDYYSAVKCDRDKCEIIPTSADCTKDIGEIVYYGNTFYVCSNLESDEYTLVEIDINNPNIFKPYNKSSYILFEINESGNFISMSYTGIK